MKCKLFPNIRRMTTGFCLGVLCVTITALALRLTVFSDMAAPPEQVESGLESHAEEGYQLSASIHFAAANSKADVFITNLSEENLINVNLVLADSGKSILTTGFINPGESRKSSRMNPYGQQLGNGVYDCIAQVTAYDPADVKKVVGTAETQVQVSIGERPDKDIPSEEK